MGWYVTIMQEMREDLGLKGNELIVYAFINGYSQGGHGCYHGSLATLMGVCGIASRQTAIDTLKSLTEKGYITKSVSETDGVKITSYQVCPKIGQGVQKLDKACPKNGHNNKYIDISPNGDINNKRFPFRKELISLGVPAALADEWMSVRAKKKATNSETAFNALVREIKKAELSAEQAVRYAVERSWSGFFASWKEKERKVAPKERKAGNGRPSAFEHNLKVMDQMFGTNFHGEAYGEKMEDEADEQ